MARPSRNDQIDDPENKILSSAWEQIARDGAAALSLRKIARALGVTAPAIYNYYPRRDDLVTALIIDAFSSLGESQYFALQDISAGDCPGKLCALGHAYRAWALRYPQRYQLIFGTPIPHYQAPLEKTTPAAANSLLPLTETLQTVFESDHFRLRGLPRMSRSLTSMLTDWKQVLDIPDLALETLYLTIVIWSRVHGLVSLELGKQFPPYIKKPEEIYSREINALLSQYFSVSITWRLKKWLKLM